MQERLNAPRPRTALFAVGRSAADGMRLIVLRPREAAVRGPWDLHALVRGTPAPRSSP
jgi:hypothetical protein